MRRWAIASMGLVSLAMLVAWIGSVAVEPGEVVVVRRLGRVLPEPWGPGLHWAWPLGVDRTMRLRLDEVRRLEFGRIGPAGPLDPPGAVDSRLNLDCGAAHRTGELARAPGGVGGEVRGARSR